MAAELDRRASGIRVLCVDDDPDFRDLVEIYLGERRTSIAVETAADGEAAIERIEAGGVDCVVSDFRMPGMDGVELLAAVRERASALPFILFTARGGEDVAAEAVSAGVTDYIQKSTDPAQFDLLANRIRNVVERHRARVQYQAVFDGVSEALLVIDARTGAVDDANRRAGELWGYPKADLVGRSLDELRVPEDEGAEEPTRPADSTAVPLGADDSPLANAAGPAAAGLDDAVWHCEARDGRRFWGAVSRKAATIDGRERTLVIVRDVTRRRVRQRQLDDLLATVRDLLVVETEPAIAEVIERTVVERLRFDDATMYVFDPELGGFRRAGADAEPEAESTVRPADAERLWDALDAGEVVADGPETDSAGSGASTEPASSPTDPGPASMDLDGRTVLYLPLGEVGVLRCAAGPETDPHDVELATLLATFAAGAVDRCRREAQLREREAELRDQRDELLSLDHVNAVIRDINQALVSVSSREGIEQLVCEKFVATDQYRLAWLGEHDAGDATIRPRVSAGRTEGYLPAAIEVGEGADSPVARAVADRRVVVVDRITPQTVPADRYQLARERGFRSVAFVPVVHEQVLYRVLAVYAGEPHAFSERERTVLGELGETIGHALAAAEWRSARISATVVEVDLAVEHDRGLFALGDGDDARLELTDMRETDAGALRVFGRLVGSEFGAFEAAVGGAGSLAEATRVADREDETRVAFTVRAGPVLSAVRSGGVSLRTGTIADGRGTFGLTIPSGTDVRWLVEQLEGAFERVDLLGRRDRRRSESADRLDGLVEGLTDRQQETLRTAFHAGYFETPRTASGTDVADLLGVTQPTFNEHLRNAERLVYEGLLGS